MEVDMVPWIVGLVLGIKWCTFAGWHVSKMV